MCFEWLQIILDDIPNIYGIDLIISMYYMMTHVGNDIPLCLWVCFYKRSAEFIGCLTDNHCIINNAAKLNLVRNKSFLAHPFCPFQNGVDCVKDVQQTMFISKRFSHKSIPFLGLHYLPPKGTAFLGPLNQRPFLKDAPAPIAS